MKKSCTRLLLLLLAVLWFTACKKDNLNSTKNDPCPWPEITTEGKHTLGFKINGKEWVPCVDLYAMAATLRTIDASLTESDGSNALSIVGTRSMLSTNDSTISGYGIHFRPLQEGIINTQVITSCSFRFSSRKNGVLLNEWNLPLSKKGFHLEILKLDTALNIVSGIFEAVLEPMNGTDTLYITDGRFDLKYYPQ